MGLALRGGTQSKVAVSPMVCDTSPRVSVISDLTGMMALEEEWSVLFAACERSSPCASFAWAWAWWQAFGQNAEGAGEETALAVFVFRDGEGRLVGVVPCVEDRPANALRVRRLRMLGHAWRRGVFDMTEEPSLLAAEEWTERILAALVREIRRGLESGRWDAASLRTHGTPLDGLTRDLHPCAWVKADVRAGSDYAELPVTWAEYRKRMTRSMRDNLPYYPRLLTRDGHIWSVRLLRQPDEMSAAVVRLAELHRSRAKSEKGRRHDAHIHGSVQEAFLTNLLRRLAKDGKATVGELVVDGKVVASQAFVEAGDTLTVYYSGYREAFYKYSPIFVIDSVVFRDALERGVRRLDFLRGPAPWKTRWLAQPGPRLCRAVIVSRRPESSIRYVLFWTGDAYHRNVADRLPVLTKRLAGRLNGWRTVLERSLVPFLPVVSRLSLRAAPTMHWALAQAPLHHR